jgi:hypothetical protein
MSTVQGVGSVSAPAWRQSSAPRSSPGSPPETYLPSTQQVLSQLTPGDRAAIAAATGYRLSSSGEITNPGGLPPWSFILGYAEQCGADRAQSAPAQPQGQVDVLA